jgi:NADPH-dependent 2,4-dienoyl-CoA reductase/sulfur reductase-like enzyme
MSLEQAESSTTSGCPRRRIVIIGGGPAGVAAALAAKQQDAAAEVVLLSEELHEPYEKPPLSKAVLMGKARAHDALIAGPKGVAGGGIILRLGWRAGTIDRAARTIVSTEGEPVAYDALVLATGSFNRVLPALPPSAHGVFYLRTETEARAIEAHLAAARSLLVVGGGLIGLEVAASAVERGVSTSVIEIAPRLLARVCDEETSKLIEQRHHARGVDVRLHTGVRAKHDLPDGRINIETTVGESITADLVVVGTGALPDDALAKAAGLAAAEGVVVDDHCRTSGPAIYAAGDCTRFPGPHGPVRLENWRHALEHGAVAGRNAAGADVSYNVAPSFWSEQYDMYIQGVGWQVIHPSARVRRPLSAGAALLFELDGDRVAYAVGINAQREIAVARRLIERRVPVDAAALADPAKPLSAMLKGKV